jgi:redox-sensitive bicupin YhaK (pirin superfamily)
MLDEFYSDDPNDYIAGFPSHPHRGFETVTYMLDGIMRHEDSVGNKGDLGPGDVQWMSAARGIIHSEMPQQTEGRMRGFQLWINLPANEKMNDPRYQEIEANNVPVISDEDGMIVRLIAGRWVKGSVTTVGPVQSVSTDPYYLDVRLPEKGTFTLPIPDGHNAFLYLYEGNAFVGEKNERLAHRSAAILSESAGSVLVRAGDSECRFLLFAGKPINEPVVQYGPFVMNTREEIEQAIADYQSGTLV